MIGPGGKLQRSRPPGLAPTRARRADAGIARAPGLVVAGVTAAIVAAIGLHFFPVRPRQPPATAAPVPGAVVDAQAPVATGPAGADAAAQPPAVAEAGTVAAKIADAAAAEKTAAEPATREKTAAAE